MLLTMVLTFNMFCIDVVGTTHCILIHSDIKEFCMLFAELKQLEMDPVPENLMVVDLSWYDLLMNTSLSYTACLFCADK